MAQTRVAACAAAALLVIGAVMHFRPAPKLSAESFVSAAWYDMLDKCETPQPIALEQNMGGNLASPGGPFINMPWDGLSMGGGARAGIYVVKGGPCACKKSVCTNGRVCDTAGATGQCYLPRCPPTGTNIDIAYTAGCFCAHSSVFTSSDKAAAFVSFPLPTKKCVVDAVATEDCQCGDATLVLGNAPYPNYCYKGQTCSHTGTHVTADTGSCDGVKTHYPQEYAYAVPSISSNAFMDATKFAICKSTAFTTRQCSLPAPAATQEGTQASPTCTVVG